MPALGEWTLGDVERLLAEFGAEFAEREEEFAIYLESFRDVVEPDGYLPGGVEAVAADVFAPLIRRAKEKGAG
jgi:hypothetical protein